MADNQTLELNLGGPVTTGNPERQKMMERAAGLASKGVFVGTSSWKYPGWCGQLYTRSRYERKGKLNEQLFKTDCLKEYAEVFKTVGIDATYYAFPSESNFSRLCRVVPKDFRFGMKVTGELTIKRFTQESRFARQADEVNQHFLDAELFKQSFLSPIEAHMDQVGVMMFEFSKFYPSDYEHGRDFVADLDRFFSRLPKGLPYGIEIRNQYFLKPDYFEMLSRHGVTHVFNNWSAMPTVGEQMVMAGSITNRQLCAARFLLKPGRKYQEAVDSFTPYNEVKAPDPEARAAGAKLITGGVETPGRRTFIFVNNRLEGNALGTIAAMLAGAELASARS